MSAALYVIHKKPMYVIKLAKSKALLKEYIDRYNTDRPLREQLRQAHRDLAEALLVLYSLAIEKHQVYVSPISPGDTLPCLKSNNVQLSKKMNCSERTVINLRRRLSASGLTVWHDWHGTNSQFELMLNPEVLHLETWGDPTNQVEAFSTIRFQCMTQSLRHTVTSYILQVTNKLIKLGGEENQQPAVLLENGCELTVDIHSTDVEKPKEVVGLPLSGRKPDTEPGTVETGYTTSSDSAGYSPPVAPAPPRGGFQRQGFGSRLREKMGIPAGHGQPDVQNPVKETPNVQNPVTPPPASPLPPAPEAAGQKPGPGVHAPSCFSQVTEGLAPDQVHTLTGHINVLWTAAVTQLYADKYICEEEETRARAYLSEYLRWAKPERWSLGATEILERIILVKKWIERGKKQEINRWVPLPSLYFDIRNPNGFTRTKGWYKLHVVKRAEIKNAELLTKAFNAYVRSLQPGATTSPEDTYRKISQNLGKRDQLLLDQFNRKILEYRHAS